MKILNKLDKTLLDNRLCISIDFDNTFTAAPKIFSKFIKDCLDNNIKVICVTARSEQDSDHVKNLFSKYDINIPIYFTNGGFKKLYMQDKCRVDIWIDDNPNSL